MAQQHIFQKQRELEERIAHHSAWFAFGESYLKKLWPLLQLDCFSGQALEQLREEVMRPPEAPTPKVKA
eukprot:12906309-Prorocentrum_lima.AAC.1